MDLNYLHEYAEETANELSAKFFHDKFIIEGSSIINFCSLNQVNFFVLKNLFEEWKKETEKLKSPFFNFDHEDVKSALNEFMEKLSFHIHIEKKDFLPLLQSAIEETILLVLSPKQYLKNVIIQPTDEFIHLKTVKEQAKYTKLNTHVLEGIITTMEEKNKDSILIDELTPVLDKLFEDESKNYNHEDFLEEINDLFPLDVVQLLGQKNTIGSTEPVLEEDHAQNSSQNEEQAAQQETSSINDLHKGTDIPSLNDELNKSKIQSLKSAFGLNQRYLFINKLFQGDEMVFSEAINKTDSFTNYEEAVNYLLDSYSEQFGWGEEESTVAELFGMIDRRF